MQVTNKEETQIDKRTVSAGEAVKSIHNGAVVLVGGFGDSGSPVELIHAVAESGVRDLTIVSNNAGTFDKGIAKLILNEQVSKVICSYPVGKSAYAIKDAVENHKVELEIVPQGVLAERMRAAGSGLGGILVKTGLGTELEVGKDIVEVEGERWILEKPLKADIALVSASQGDRWGNLSYRLAQQNFNPLMAMAATMTIAQVRNLVALGGIPPELVHTPSIFVDQIVHVSE